jgi:hypothetical protein
LHGHGHPEQRLELGYLIKEDKLRGFFDQELTISERSTSLGNLIGKPKGASLRDWLFGPGAFGTLMSAKGFPSIPSQQDPYPGTGEKYFNGGYNTKRFTGIDYPNVFGWQIECNYKGVRDASGRPAFAQAFTEVITGFIQQFPFVKMPASSSEQVK